MLSFDSAEVIGRNGGLTLTSQVGNEIRTQKWVACRSLKRPLAFCFLHSKSNRDNKQKPRITLIEGNRMVDIATCRVRFYFSLWNKNKKELPILGFTGSRFQNHFAHRVIGANRFLRDLFKAVREH